MNPSEKQMVCETQNWRIESTSNLFNNVFFKITFPKSYQFEKRYTRNRTWSNPSEDAAARSKRWKVIEQLDRIRKVVITFRFNFFSLIKHTEVLTNLHLVKMIARRYLNSEKWSQTKRHRLPPCTPGHSRRISRYGPNLPPYFRLPPQHREMELRFGPCSRAWPYPLKYPSQRALTGKLCFNVSALSRSSILQEVSLFQTFLFLNTSVHWSKFEPINNGLFVSTESRYG